MIKRCFARFAVFAFLQGILSGCLVVSLQPAYDDESVVFDQALVGRWVNTEDETSAAIERGDWRSYKVAWTDRFATRNFHGNLTRIGPATYLDLTEVRGTDDGPFLLPVHGVFRVSVAPDVLSVSPLDYNWFTRAIGGKTVPGLFATFDSRRNVVIASATADLRRWLAAAPAEAFAAASRYRRAGGAGEAGAAGRWAAGFTEWPRRRAAGASR